MQSWHGRRTLNARIVAASWQLTRRRCAHNSLWQAAHLRHNISCAVRAHVVDDCPPSAQSLCVHVLRFVCTALKTLSNKRHQVGLCHCFANLHAHCAQHDAQVRIAASAHHNADPILLLQARQNL